MTTAEGQNDGVTANGPTNKFDGVSAHPEVDGCTDQDVKSGIRNRQSWQLGESAAPSSGFALGQNRPD